MSNVAQRAMTAGEQPPASQRRQQPLVPLVYRPEPKKVVSQRMTVSAQGTKLPKAPPAYRPQPTPKALQMKKAPAKSNTARQDPRPTPQKPVAPNRQPARVVQRREGVGPKAFAIPRTARSRHFAGGIIQRSLSSSTDSAESDSSRDLIGEALQDTSYLHGLSGKGNTSDWNAGKKELAFADHKFPKSALAWLYDHMTEAQRNRLRQALWLSKNSGAKSLARLRSNLIAPVSIVTRELVESNNRTDDPHHNREQSLKGEEGLDLVRDTSGALTPRSQIVQSLAQGVVQQIYLKYKLALLCGTGESFMISDTDANEIIAELRRMEEIHFAVELNPSLPSHSSADVFIKEKSGKFSKSLCPVVSVPIMDLSVNFDTISEASFTENDTRRQIISRWIKWKLKPSANDLEDMQKCDLCGSKGWWVRYVHGDRRGQMVKENGNPIYEPKWQVMLKDYVNGLLDADDIPWLDKLFI
jgi:hypothetical protein